MKELNSVQLEGVSGGYVINYGDVGIKMYIEAVKIVASILA